MNPLVSAALIIPTLVLLSAFESTGFIMSPRFLSSKYELRLELMIEG
jgi:hypothetical protein